MPMGHGFQEEEGIRDQPSGRSSSGSESMSMSPLLSFEESSPVTVLRDPSSDSERRADSRSSMTAVMLVSTG